MTNSEVHTLKLFDDDKLNLFDKLIDGIIVQISIIGLVFYAI